MTRQEAIDIIISECYVFNPLNFDRSIRINTALDMAVKSLRRDDVGNRTRLRNTLDVTHEKR